MYYLLLLLVYNVCLQICIKYMYNGIQEKKEKKKSGKHPQKIQFWGTKKQIA